MDTLVIRNVEDDLHIRLKSQAAANRRSMEVDARVLLRQGLAGAAASSSRGFGQAMRRSLSHWAVLIWPIKGISA